MDSRRSFAILFAIYMAAMIWVWSGVQIASDWNYLSFMMTHLMAAAATAGLLLSLPLRSGLSGLNVDIAGQAVLASIVSLALIHYWFLGDIPMVTASLSHDSVEVSQLRSGISDVPVWVRYIPPLVLKVAVPFFSVYYLDRVRDKIAGAIVLVGVLYGASLMQKSYPLFAVGPAVVYLALNGQWGKSLIGAAAGGGVVAFMVLATNPALRPALWEQMTFVTTAHAAQAAAPAPPAPMRLFNRVALGPGLSVYKWLEAFPAVMPHDYGCGYRFVAPLIGCEFKPYSTILHQYYYPQFMAQGVVGSLNAAHFATEYAGFGRVGLVMAGVLAVATLYFAAFMSASLPASVVVALNFPFIMALSSTSLHTTLASGGWGLMLVLMAVFLRQGSKARRRTEGNRFVIPLWGRNSSK